MGQNRGILIRDYGPEGGPPGVAVDWARLPYGRPEMSDRPLGINWTLFLEPNRGYAYPIFGVIYFPTSGRLRKWRIVSRILIFLDFPVSEYKICEIEIFEKIRGN